MFQSSSYHCAKRPFLTARLDMVFQIWSDHGYWTFQWIEATEMGFQIDDLNATPDWLPGSKRSSDWQRVSKRQNQFVNPPQRPPATASILRFFQCFTNLSSSTFIRFRLFVGIFQSRLLKSIRALFYCQQVDLLHGDSIGNHPTNDHFGNQQPIDVFDPRLGRLNDDSKSFI